MVKQISVFMENRVGMLSKFAKAAADANIEILAMCVADTTDFGILRCIVDDPDKFVGVLREDGFTASQTNVLIVKLEDGKQTMSDVFDTLSESTITVEYLYSFARSFSNNMAMIFKVNRPDKAFEALTAKGINLADEEELSLLK